jgi:predicted DCC family thiol-disulfide oxidoreductase YuxK
MTAMAPLLLYDGTCGFCAASVAFVLRHERQHTLRFATLQGTVGSEILRRHPQLEGVDSMVWVDPAPGGHQETVFVCSAAALRAARYLGGAWSLLTAGNLLPARLRDRIYDWCFVPTLEQASRFLDRDPAASSRPAGINAPGLAVLPRARLEDSGGHHSP